MQQIKTADDIKQLGSILCVWAHPDDESFSCAGIMATAIQNGQGVACVTATKGEAGVQDESRWPAAKLGDIRAHEMDEALKCIGCHHHHWMSYADGHCHEVASQEAVAMITSLIEQYQPNTILTFGPDGMTGHTDHQTVSRWVDQATKDTNIKVYHAVEEEERYVEHMIEADEKFNIYFNIDKPPVFKLEDCDIAYKLPAEILAKKRQALQAMPSQTDRMFANTPINTMDAMLGLECFVLANRG